MGRCGYSWDFANRSWWSRSRSAPLKCNSFTLKSLQKHRILFTMTRGAPCSQSHITSKNSISTSATTFSSHDLLLINVSDFAIYSQRKDEADSTSNFLRTVILSGYSIFYSLHKHRDAGASAVHFLGFEH